MSGNEFTVKTGTNGQSQTKTFDDEAAVQKSADKLIAEKTRKSDVETDGSSAPEVAAAPTKAKQVEVPVSVAAVIAWDAPRVTELEPIVWLFTLTNYVHASLPCEAARIVYARGSQGMLTHLVLTS